MFSRVMLLFLTCYLSSSTTSMIIYNNAQFVPINATFKFTVLYSISSLNECACQCFINSTCFTGTYFSINQSCSLFSIPLRREWLQVVATIMNASVFSITNRSLIVLESTKETTREITTITTVHSTLVSSTSTCVNTEISPAGRTPTIAWYFENNLKDRFGIYNGTGLNNPTYGLGRNGCGKCLNLTSSLQQSVLVNVTPYIDLRSISFSVEAWIKPTGNVSDGIEHVILGQCPVLQYQQCMRTSIGSPGVMSFLFRSDTQSGTRVIPVNVWSHMAYVYNLTALTMTLYFNGTLEGSSGSHGPFQGAPYPFEIGNVAAYVNLYFFGCIDEISFYPFARTAAEIAATVALG